MPDRPEMVLRLTQHLARLDEQEPLPLRLCRAAVEVVDGSEGAISLGYRTSGRTLLCATSEMATRFEEAQDLVSQGPALEALQTGTSVVSLSRAEQQRRWPTLDHALGELPVAAVHVLPMRPAASLVGVLTMHHEVASAAAVVLPDLEFLADAIGAAVLGHLPLADDADALWSERDRITQATGMVVAQLDVDPDDALAVLRAHAFAQDVTLLEVSRRVLARDLGFGTGRAR